MNKKIIPAFIMVIISVFGCELISPPDIVDENNPPEIVEINFSPAYGGGGTVFTLTAQATDKDNDQLTFLWTCDDGEFIEGSTSSQTKWQAPLTLTDEEYLIQLDVSDGVESVNKTATINITGAPEAFDFTDNRDGNTYHAISIGNQTWMTENLAYLPSVSPASSVADDSPYYYVFAYEGSNVTSAKETDNYRDYGVLYNFEAALSACPAGWHLPTDDEWKDLEIFLGMNSTHASGHGIRTTGDVGKKLKSTSGWYDDGNGDNSSGFNALPGGSQYSGNIFSYMGKYGYFWTSSSLSQSYAWYRYLLYDKDGVSRGTNKPARGYSVRCIKND